MVCACCVSLPNASFVLASTGFALVAGARALPQHGRPAKVATWCSYLFCGLLVFLALLLIALDSHPGLRNKSFALLCERMTRSPGLDATRCDRLGLKAISGDVIEFGPGPGTNFRCWSESSINRWVGVDPNENFAPMLDEAAAERNLTFSRAVVWLKGEDVDVVPASFDAAVLTHVLCSVTDPAAVVRQAARALKPGGKLYVMEHVAAAKGSMLRTVQDIIGPAWAIVGNGCVFADLASVLRDAPGFGALQIEEISAPVPLPIIVPHILATALKA